jgi:hypothetical protein
LLLAIRGIPPRPSTATTAIAIAIATSGSAEVFFLETGKLRSRDRRTQNPLRISNPAAIFPCDERASLAALVGTARAADSMGVGLGGARRIEIDHVVDACDIEAAGSDIRCDQDVESTIAKASHRTVPLPLTHVPLQGNRTQTLLRELKRESLRAMLRSGKDDRGLAIVLGQQAVEKVSFATFRNRIEGVFDSLGRRLDRQFDDMRLVQNLPGQLPYRPGHRCREEQVLPILWKGCENSLDVRQESHVEHVIRLVQDQRLDLRKVKTTLLQEIENSPRTSNHDLWTTLEGTNLRAGSHTAEDGHGLDLGELRKQPNFGIDLDRQFPRRRENEDEGACARLFDQPLKNRQREGGRLPGPGLGQAHHILSLEAGRNGFDLNRSGFNKTSGLEATGQ